MSRKKYQQSDERGERDHEQNESDHRLNLGPTPAIFNLGSVSNARLVDRPGRAPIGARICRRDRAIWARWAERQMREGIGATRRLVLRVSPLRRPTDSHRGDVNAG